ncbi:MAG: flagellar biosynthesis protein FliQ [Clostridium sp.]|jgi:flagellar biosynthetic protein FliQ|nr:flagellar biosynthesis protein FliQ [Clostridium sp.]
MSMEGVAELVGQALFLIIKLSLPVLLVSLVVGLVVSIFQTVTSIQEQTLSFIPKMIAVFLSLIFFGKWMLTSLVEFLVAMVESFRQIA